MKNKFSIFILLAISLNCFCQKKSTIKIRKTSTLDSAAAAELIVGLWVDTKDPQHMLMLNSLAEGSSGENNYKEEGIRRVSYSYHWDYFTKDSAETKFIDSTKVTDSTVDLQSCSGRYRIGQKPLGYFSVKDTTGTSVILIIDPIINGADFEWKRRIFLLNDTYLKINIQQSEPILFKRKE